MSELETECSMELPRYKCHKQVWALKVKEVTIVDSDGNGTLSFEDAQYSPINLPFEYFRKNDVEAGGYYVVYKGGYQSFSPADAFEDGYILES